MLRPGTRCGVPNVDAHDAQPAVAAERVAVPRSPYYERGTVIAKSNRLPREAISHCASDRGTALYPAAARPRVDADRAVGGSAVRVSRVPHGCDVAISAQRHGTVA